MPRLPEGRLPDPLTADGFAFYERIHLSGGAWSAVERSRILVALKQARGGRA